MLLTGIARIGRDAEVRYTPSGDSVVNLSLAFSYGKRDAEGKRPTTWVEAALWGKRAEALAPYLLKGGLVWVSIADLHIETYKTRDGGQGAKLVGRIGELEPAGSKGGEQAAPRSASAPAQNAPRSEPGVTGTGFDDLEGDIQF